MFKLSAVGKCDAAHASWRSEMVWTIQLWAGRNPAGCSCTLVSTESYNIFECQRSQQFCDDWYETDSTAITTFTSGAFLVDRFNRWGGPAWWNAFFCLDYRNKARDSLHLDKTVIFEQCKRNFISANCLSSLEFLDSGSNFFIYRGFECNWPLRFIRDIWMSV